MKKLPLFIIVILMLGACQTAEIDTPPPPIILSERQQMHFRKYKSFNKPMSFAATADGKRSYFTYCPHADCVDDAYDAIRKCEESTGKKCYIYAEYGERLHKKNDEITNAEIKHFVSFNVLMRGGRSVYYGKIKQPSSNGVFNLTIGSNSTCEGSYVRRLGISIILKCNQDSARGDLRKGTYKGKSDNFSWLQGGVIDLSSDRLDKMEMEILPFKGQVYNSDKLNNFTTNTYSSKEGVKRLSESQIQIESNKSSKLMSIPVQINWDGATDPIQGKLKYSNKPGGGSIKLEVTKAGVNCSGNWKFSNGSYDDGGKVRGVWAVSCSDGKAVTGEYESSEKGSGSGEGFDNNGKKVTIRYGKPTVTFDGVMQVLKDGDYSKGLKQLTKLAENGHRYAQVMLGQMYNKGKGTPPDFNMAMKWWRQAAEQGSMPAQYKLGVMYAAGKGVEVNYVKGLMWLRVAEMGGYNFSGSPEIKNILFTAIEDRLTSSQIEEAQNLARECVRKKYKGC
jgi:hypothetical protein